MFMLCPLGSGERRFLSWPHPFPLDADPQKLRLASPAESPAAAVTALTLYIDTIA